MLASVMKEVGLDPGATGVKLIRSWDRVLGERFSPHCRPEGLQHGVVLARVRDSGWMQRLQLETPRILAGLREATGEPALRDLRLRVGPIDEA